MKHKISTDLAYEIDLAWAASDSDDVLRIVSSRTAGNGSRSILCIPGNDNAPRYEYRRNDPETGEYAPGYYHVSGPTLDDLAMQAAYRDEADTLATLRQF